jgi:pSer/pThr/pTyr-binding forkhead associated (FHA) protein
MNVNLVMFKADGTRRDFPLRKSKVVLGRINSCDLRIPLSSVSRQHCQIEARDDRITVRDLGSSNGTFLNNDRIQESALTAGDELVIGPVVFTVVVDGKPAEIEPVRSMISGAGNGASIIGDNSDGESASAGLTDASSSSINLDQPLSALEELEASDASGDLPALAEDEDEARQA